MAEQEFSEVQKPANPFERRRPVNWKRLVLIAVAVAVLGFIGLREFALWKMRAEWEPCTEDNYSDRCEAGRAANRLNARKEEQGNRDYEAALAEQRYREADRENEKLYDLARKTAPEIVPAKD